MLLFITGTDTGVGKTMLTCLLARGLRARGASVAALKPICSGGRADACALRDALEGTLPLDAINPWHFRAPLAPALAQRKEAKRVRRHEVLAHLRRFRQRFDIVLVEGAGGLLSPLGEDFTARELIRALRATPIVVCPNRLGAISQARLAFAALPRAAARRATLVLVAPARPDGSASSNARFLSEVLARRVHCLPWFADPKRLDANAATPQVRRMLHAVLKAGVVLR
jgi:dethiobiotin synthetase